MRRQQNIYDKLAKYTKAQAKPKTALSKCKYDFSKKKVRLKNHNVKLSLIDDLKSNYDWLEQISSIASYYAYERLDELLDKYYEYQNEIAIEVDNMAINSGVSGLEDNANYTQGLLTEIEKVAEMLGQSPSDVYEDYDEAKELVNNASNLWGELKSEYKTFVDETSKQLVGDWF